jgi:hypothetical protein
MKNDFKHSDKRMQEKLGGFQVPAPEGAWAGIEGAMGTTRGRRRFFFFWIILLFLGVTGSAIFAFTFFSGENSGVETNTANTTTSYASQSNKTTNSQSKGQKKNNNTPKNSASGTANQNDAQQTDINGNSNGPSTNQSTRTNSSTNSSNNGVSGSNNRINGNATNSNSPNNNARNGSSRNPVNSALGNSSLPNSRPGQNGITTVLGAQNINSNTPASNQNATSSNNTRTQNGSETPNDATGTPGSSLTDASQADSNNKNGVSPKDLIATRLLLELPISGAGIPSSNQLKIEPPKSASRWSLEAGLDLSSFNYTVSGTDSTDFDFLNNSYTQSRGQGGYVRVNYQPFKHISMNSGLELTQNQGIQEFSTFTTVTVTQFDTTGFIFDSVTQQQVAIIDTNLVDTIEEQLNSITNATSQISIPIGVMFHLPLGTRSELGINVAGLVGIRTRSTGNILLDPNGNTIDVNSAYRTVNFSMRTAIRYSYKLNEHSAIYAEPYFGFGLNNQSNTTVPFVSRFRNSGLRVGFRYNF